MIDASGAGRLLDLTLAPHRSLPPTGFYIVMGFVVAVALVTGILFLVVGAWPVFGFMGLDVLALWWAMRLSYRHGLAREIVQLDERGMVVERISPSGHAVRVTMDPAWIRVEHDSDSDFARPLLLRSRNNRVEIASFLNQQERREVAAVVRDAVLRWRAPHPSPQGTS
ncbi:MAG: DUF2244 domain-containing protein [Alphaproteobacteria bacterium]|nr:DUF2244 domain-containing protein [Alphaproteobacteria bacterium]